MMILIYIVVAVTVITISIIICNSNNFHVYNDIIARNNNDNTHLENNMSVLGFQHNIAFQLHKGHSRLPLIRGFLYGMFRYHMESGLSSLQGNNVPENTDPPSVFQEMRVPEPRM